VVVEFDEHVGLGTVRDGDGAAFAFHCTAISDGTRRIDPGADVTFTVTPARLGRLEAAGLRPA
jgi:cold shock CspA family protein